MSPGRPGLGQEDRGQRQAPSRAGCVWSSVLQRLPEPHSPVPQIKVVASAKPECSPLTLCPESFPAPLLSGGRGRPARAPTSCPGRPTALGSGNKGTLSQGISSNLFLSVLGHGVCPPPSHTNPAQVRLQLCALLNICPPGELPASNFPWKAQLRGERYPFFPLRLQPGPPPPRYCPPGGATHIEVLVNGTPGFAQCTTYTAERGQPSLSPP